MSQVKILLSRNLKTTEFHGTQETLVQSSALRQDQLYSKSSLTNISLASNGEDVALGKG